MPATDVHESAVDCVVWWQVARGRTPTEYAPSADITRGQMATFIANLLEAAGGALPEPTRDWFPDDDGSVHERRIDQLREAGVVLGRADGSYGPDSPVHRDAMATFLVRAYERTSGTPLASGSDRFTDDDGTTHEPSIDKAAEAGFTGGVRPGVYEPHVPVQRGQMASFVTRVLDRLVEEGLAELP